MEKLRVLIPTAGLGSRVRPFTDTINKALLRVGNKAVISHIIQSYPEGTSFVIPLGYRANLVRRYLELAHPEVTFYFVTVDPYEGGGSSLAYSIYQAREYLQRPFIFHACDSLITTSYYELTDDWVLVSPDAIDNESLYRKTRSIGGKVWSFYEKEFHTTEKGEKLSPYVGVAGIYSWSLFWELLDNVGGLQSDVDVLSRMVDQSVRPNVIEVPSNCWFDTGSPIGLASARKNFNPDYNVLPKKDEDIYIIDQNVVKFFEDTSKCVKLKKRAKELKDLVPELREGSMNLLSYKKVDGKVFSKTITPERTEEFLDWAKLNLWDLLEDRTKRQGKSFEEACRKFYIEKTEDRVNKYLQMYGEDTECIINGDYVPTINTILGLFQKYHPIKFGYEASFHGDMVLDNIIDTGYDYVLIDWRTDFAGNIKKGDVYYDLAKFAHSLVIKHDVLLSNQFKVVDLGVDKVSKKPIIRLDLHRSEIFDRCLDVFKEWVLAEAFSWNKIQILMGAIWLSMAPLHPPQMARFLFTYGKYHLYKSLMEYREVMRKEKYDQNTEISN
jgi:NDP-sugar pyrophosphorylase family protein